MDYIKIVTNKDVWQSIKNVHHKQLKVFSSYSATEGDRFCDPDLAVMETSYGLKDSDYPLMCSRTTWSVNRENLYKRDNETNEYWLYVIKIEE